MKKRYLKRIIIYFVISVTLVVFDLIILYYAINHANYFSNMNERLAFVIMACGLVILPAFIVVSFTAFINTISDFKDIIIQYNGRLNLDEKNMNFEDMSIFRFEEILDKYCDSLGNLSDEEIERIKKLVDRRNEILDLNPEIDINAMSKEDYNILFKTIEEFLNESNSR